MSFYICHCGNTPDKHYFRHKYEEKAKVFRKRENSIEEFVLNSHHFNVKKKIKCKVENCSASASIHNTTIVEHTFIPFEYEYREIIFTLPEDAICNHSKCGKKISEHAKILTHKFTTKLIIENVDKKDSIKIVNPIDEDLTVNVVM